MRVTLARPVFILLAATAVLAAADWLSERGDPQRSGWQKHETALNAPSVKDLKLLWRLPLGGSTAKRNILRAPVILGPIFTHRGVKELVFAASSGDNFYAVDADLGRLFWSRHFDVAASATACGDGLTAAPAITPEPVSIADDGEGHSPMRPIYVVTSDGALHGVSPSTGEDLAAASPFLPPHATAFGLSVTGGTASVWTAAGCGVRAGWWSRPAGNGRGQARFLADEPLPINAASWEDIAGTSWTYAVAGRALTARHGSKVVWTSREMVAPLPPVVANGVVYLLDGGSVAAHAVLYAFDAMTGKERYSSGAAVPTSSHSSLALANGHVCFAGADDALYCFGLPLEI